MMLHPVVWDQKTPLFSELTEDYFYDIYELSIFIADTGYSLESLGLVLCEPLNPLDAESLMPGNRPVDCGRLELLDNLL